MDEDAGLLPLIRAPRPLVPGTRMGLRSPDLGLAEGAPLVIVAERRVGGNAPGHHRVGTLARLTALRAAPDGGLYLEVVGERLVALRDGDGAGNVGFREIDDTPPAVPPSLIDDVGRALRSYMAARAEAGEGGDVGVTLSRDPVSAADEVASHLRISWPEIQELLEAGGAGDRLQRALALLRRETALLRSVLGRKGTTWHG